MKKQLLFITTIMIVMTVLPVFATNITTITNTDSTGNIEVIYTVDDSYLISIPETLNLLKGKEVKRTISAEDVCIGYGTELRVTISGANCEGKNWYIRDEEVGHEENVFEYMISTVNASGDISSGDSVLTVPAGNTEGGSSDLYFWLKDDVTKSGTYSDLLTFKAEIVTSDTINVVFE